MAEVKVGVLGATGTVGQRFIQLLETHPIFKVAALGASERSSGKPYNEATSWKMQTPIPSNIKNMVVQTCDPANFVGCKIIFSGLDANVAGEIELDFLKNEYVVFSNAKNHRMNPIVPLMVPLVNSNHFEIISHQQKAFNLKRGFLVTNANCSTTGLVVALKALKDAFGPLSKVAVTTMQAISGAGYPGVPSLDVLGNVIPYISGEEEKIEIEVGKILSDLDESKSSFLADSAMKISASCNRVPVIDGHTESVFVEFRNSQPTIEKITEAFSKYSCEAQGVASTCPINPIVVVSERDRPQPRLDLLLGNGNSVVVGGIRPCNIFHVKFTLLSHNTILGAAGSSIMNAEIAYAKGLIQ